MFVTPSLLRLLMHSLQTRECYLVHNFLSLKLFEPNSSSFLLLLYRYIMVIVSNTAQNGGQEWGRGVQTAATLLNIQKARSHFEQFIPRS